MSGSQVVTVRLFDDDPHHQREWSVAVTDELAAVLACAHAWNGLQPWREDRCTLTFSSVLAAMVSGPDPLCAWLRGHLALRGVPEHLVTRGHPWQPSTLPDDKLWTTYSFRQAEQEARRIAGERVLDIRHFMAAYAVIEDYHREDYLRLRIDRRAWCTELADTLCEMFPGERELWQRYRRRAPAVAMPACHSDVPEGTDLLGIGREVEAFAMLIAGSETRTPLSIGVFGTWGSGKSYFMARVQERIAELAAGNDPRYCRKIARVRFSGWHYSESNVIASLVDQIARDLRLGPAEVDRVLAERRAEAVSELDAAEANARRLRAAKGKAEQDVRKLGAQLDDARRKAPAQEARAVLARTLLENPEFDALQADVRRAAHEARRIGLNASSVLVGLAVLGLTALAVTTLSIAHDAKVLTVAVGAVAAVAPLVRRSLKVLSELAAKGEAFRAAVQGRVQEAADALARVGQRVQQLSSDLVKATDQVEEKRRALDALGAAALLDEAIAELSTTDVYRSELGVLARARVHFQGLADRIRRAREGKPNDAPALDRIVLYIDDLDRCPADKVREVLRAVHLLLAFDPFVCVVAADPRWILQCLHDSPGVISADVGDDPDLAVLGRPPTASDYLEKIIQIPLWLRPIPDRQRAAFVGALLGARPEAARDRAGERPQRRSAGDGGSGGASGSVTVASASELDPRELAFLLRAERLLDGNARALKRFANTYRLVKTSISDVELEYFVTGRRTKGVPHRICMAQLAVLATQRSRARWLVRLADEAHDATLGEWLTALDAHGEPEVRRLAADLGAVLLPEHATMPFEHFTTWLERTRRYSFYL